MKPVAGKIAYLSAGMLSLMAAPLAALEYDYSLYSSAEVSDNIRQGWVAQDVSGTILTGGISFGANTDEEATIAAEVDGDIRRMFYSEGDLDNENRGFLDAAALWQPDSTNFRLTVLNSLRQTRQDRRSVRVVNNLRDVNIFAVMPSYHIDLTSRSRLLASYTYSNITDETDLSDRDVNTVSAGYEYQVSNLSALSLNASRSDIEFTEAGQSVEQDSAFVRWTYDGLLTNWMADIGRQEIVEVNDTGMTMVNFSIDRQVNNRSSVGLFIQRGYSSVVDSSVSGRLTAVVPNGDAVYAEELAREEQVTLSYDYNRGSLQGGLSLNARQLQSEEAVSIGRLVDEDEYSVYLTGAYRFPAQQHSLSAFGLGASYRYMDERFNDTGLENEINEAAIRLNYFATRTTNMFFELRSRNASGNGPQSDTDENSFLVGIRFSPRGGY